MILVFIFCLVFNLHEASQQPDVVLQRETVEWRFRQGDSASSRSGRGSKILFFAFQPYTSLTLKKAFAVVNSKKYDSLFFPFIAFLEF